MAKDMLRMFATLARAFVAFNLAGTAMNAHAQDAVDPEAATSANGRSADLSSDGDIVVTAQKRSELLSKTPISMSALSGDQLQSRNLTSVQDLSGTIPNLNISNYGGSSSVNIRGVGRPSASPGGEAATAIHLNSVFLSRPFEATGSFLDLERVELLRGPQGTLYGRNATGGTLNLVTARPKDRFEGYAQVSAGNYDYVHTEAVLSGPIAGDVLLARVAFSTDDRDGFSRNLFDGRRYDDMHAQTVRGTLVFAPSDDVSFTLVGDYHREHDGNYATHFLGVGVPGTLPTGVLAGGATVPLDASGAAINPRLLNIDSRPRNRRQYGGIMLDGSIALNPNLTVKTLSSYRRARYTFTGDFDGTTASFPSNDARFNYVQGERVRQFSQELQLNGDYDSLKFIAGLYYLDQKLDPAFYDFGFYPAATPFGLLASGKAGIKAYAAFGQATYKITDRLGLTVGIRYSEEKRTVDENWTSGGVQLVGTFLDPCATLPGFVCAQKGSAKFNSLTPKFGLDFQVTPDLMLYASASKGFRSGGFSVGDLKPPFEPETLWAYEAGIKGKAGNGILSGSLSAFHYDYSNLQITQIVNGYSSTVNAATSKVDGLELETTLRPIDGLSISNAFSYLRSRFKHFDIADPAFPELGVQDLSGNRLPFAPKFTNSLSISYEILLGGFTLRPLGEWNWRDRIFFTEFNSTNAMQPKASLFNTMLRLSPEVGRWYAEIWAKNLTNETIISQNFISSGALGRPRNGQLENPRTYGITVRYDL